MSETPPGLKARNCNEAFALTAERHADRVALRTLDDAISWTYAELAERVARVAGGLARLGVGRGDTVGLMLTNRPEFHLLDLAVLHLGATPFSIYNTSSPEQIAYLLGDAAPTAMVAERDFVETIEASGAAPAELVAVDELDSLYAGPVPVAEADPADVLTLIYTSGTTGPPKGVMTTHANMLAELRAVHDRFAVSEAGRMTSFLPSAHIADRWGTYYSSVMVYGHTLTPCPDPKQLFDYVRAVKPTVFGAVPRIWEKARAGLEAAGAPNEAAKPALGLDEAEILITGASATPPEVMTFFAERDMPLCEVWGMSETTCCATMVTPDELRIGSVGRALPGVELRLADDGELLVRGDIVMSGYRNRPEQTAETIDEDGWLATGDIATIDDDGFVSIVDRKKELIINAAGKNMSPANIESALKSASPLIGQAMCVGDNRPYNVALLVLDPDAAAGRDPADPKLHAEIEEAVARANATLSRVEQIKRFAILGEEWQPGGEELTPTMKLKRKPIAAKYAAEIAALYA